MSPNDAASPTPDPSLRGIVHAFEAFCKGERERRRNAEDDFDPALFDEAVAYILRKLATPAREAES